MEDHSLLNNKKLPIILLVFFGFILRLVASRNLGVSADDVNHAVRPIGIFSSGKLVIWDQSTSLWYYIQAFFYKLIGYSQIGSRFATVVFGTATILLIYLFTKSIFKSEKVALFSSLLVALSPLLIRETLPEMDVAASFFIILSAFFLFLFIENKRKANLLMSALALGIGTMIKLYVLIFGLSFLLFLAYIQFNEKTPSKDKIRKFAKHAFVFIAIVFLLCMPTLAHNYLLYKDKGFMDLIFTNTLRLGVSNAENYYNWGAGWLPKTDYFGFFFGNQSNFDPTPIPGFLIVLSFLFKGDPLLFILGIVGLFISFKHNRKYFWFLILSFVPTFIYLGAQIPMAKHFIWGILLFAPLSAWTLAKLSEKVKIKYLFVIILLFNLLYLGMPRGVDAAPFYGESSFGKLVDFKNNHISDNSIVVADSRIYRGNIHWALADTNYIEASQFFDLAAQINKVGPTQNIEVYYVECVIDDCGWGTVEKQPDFNESMEQVTSFFENKSYLKEDFEGPDLNSYYLPFIGKKRTDYRIYKTELQLNPQIINYVEKSHIWFLYPIGYDRSISPIFDDFRTNGPIDKIIYGLSWVILYLEILVTFLAIIYIVYLFIRDNE